MLHYYFKTKEQLFDKVFAQAFELFAGKIAEVLNDDLKLEDKITAYVNYTIDSLAKDPGIPIFVLNELSHSPERITDLFAGKNKINLDKFRDQVEKQTSGQTDVEMLFIDMVALCIYPFIVAPVFKKLLQKSDQQYALLLRSRKAHIITEILNRLYISPAI
jgi:TetR/AcrR family transcriptional regulator